jgi:hypothetical protein
LAANITPECGGVADFVQADIPAGPAGALCMMEITPYIVQNVSKLSQFLD